MFIHMYTRVAAEAMLLRCCALIVVVVKRHHPTTTPAHTDVFRGVLLDYNKKPRACTTKQRLDRCTIVHTMCNVRFIRLSNAKKKPYIYLFSRSLPGRLQRCPHNNIDIVRAGGYL